MELQIDTSYDEHGRVSSLAYPSIPGIGRPRVDYQYDASGFLVSMGDPLSPGMSWLEAGTTLFADTTSVIHPDRLGSPSVVTTRDGAVLARMSFDPFGGPRDPDWSRSTPAPAVPELGMAHLGWTGHTRDAELDLIEMNARYYSPRMGRFLQPDPILTGLDSQSLNPYSYVRNRPTRLVDPTGMEECDDCGGPWEVFLTDTLGWAAEQLFGGGDGDGDDGDSGGGDGGNDSEPRMDPPGTCRDQSCYDARADQAESRSAPQRTGTLTESYGGSPSGEAPGGWEVATVGGMGSGAWGLWDDHFDWAGIEASVNVLAGYGDGLTFGLTAFLRENLDIASGVIDMESAEYQFGDYAGITVGTVLSLGAGGGSGGRAVIAEGAGGVTAGVGEVAAGGSGRATTRFIDDVAVTSHGGVVGRGAVDVGPTVQAIESGQLAPRNIFQNRPLPGRTTPELPVRPPGYYQEFVHPTPGVRGVGPQRIVRGQGGELYYTPDHYQSFIPLN